MSSLFLARLKPDERHALISKLHATQKGNCFTCEQVIDLVIHKDTVVTMEVLDDTLPGGPRQVTRTFKASFARASREDDYRIAWAFFEENK